jgi:hypothetical protein
MYQESDWTILKELLPKWRERYLAKKNQEILKLLTKAEKTHTEQFWNAKAKLDSEAKILEKCCEGLTRSNLHHSLISMYRCNFIGKEDLVRFSDQIRDHVMDAARYM